MSKIYISSDFHLGHFNIISYTDRPFKTVDEMNDKIIKNTNDRVKKDDTLYHIGDFCFRNTPGGKKGEGQLTKAQQYENLINSKIIFISGNHDSMNSCKTPIESIVIKLGGYRIKLVHNPKFADPLYNINLCGHVHNNWKIKYLSSQSVVINVGVDVWKFMPIDINEILKLRAKFIRQYTFEDLHTREIRDI